MENNQNQQLIALAASLTEKRAPFVVGDVITWKDGLRNKRFPEYGEVAVVSRVMEEPVFDSVENGGSIYFREPLDVVVAIIDSDGDLVELHLDSRRLRPA